MLNETLFFFFLANLLSKRESGSLQTISIQHLKEAFSAIKPSALKELQFDVPLVGYYQYKFYSNQYKFYSYQYQFYSNQYQFCSEKFACEKVTLLPKWFFHKKVGQAV